MQILNPRKKTSTTKIAEHIRFAYSMPTISTFDSIENNYGLSRGKDCMRKFFISLREHAADVSNSVKKKTLSLTETELKSNQNAMQYHIFRKKIQTKT